MLTDLTREELEVFQPDVEMPPDFQEFWDATLRQSRSIPAVMELQAAKTPIETIEYYDVTFAGYNGDPIKGWLAGKPGFTDSEKQAVIVEYLGYGGGRGIPGEKPFWPSSGYVHFIMDTRGQGGDYGTGGDTADPHPLMPHALGLFTNGIEDKETYYYRRLITDAFRAVDAALTLPFIDENRIFCVGASQGGGLASIVSAAHPAVRAGLPDVAFLGNLMRGVMLSDRNPYKELERYLRVKPDNVALARHTLSYFDAVNFARFAKNPAFFSVALMDEYVPPSCTYSIYNSWANEHKKLTAYEFSKHEGAGMYHLLKQHEWLQQFN